MVTTLAGDPLFIAASLLYFAPVLQGKMIYQSDIVQYTGMAKEQNEYRAATGEEPYWTDSAFGGMPTYQLGADYPYNFIKKLDKIIRFLPRPADYLFLYLIGFYILLLVLKVEYRMAALGALAFGFSTYLIIILGVGHNAKAHAIGYFPLVLAGILRTFQGKYISGFLLTAFSMALEINANHFQMTYYLLLLVLVLGVVYLIDTAKKRTWKHFGKSIGILVVAVVLGVLTNTANLIATQEYVGWSTRGKSELTLNPDGSPRPVSTGLDREYITEYSYGILESFNLFIPRLLGGSNGENLGEDSHTFDFLVSQGVSPSQALEFTSSLPTYWGDQTIVAAPAYIGAVVWLLFLVAVFLVRSKHKWWLLGGVVFSLLLSWGKNFGVLTDFMIDYFPMYNKFRAVSSIQVILELCIPVMAVLGLRELALKETSEEAKLRAIKLAVLILGGLGVLLYFMQGTFDFMSASDAIYRQYYGNELVNAIVADREAIFQSDSIRSVLFVLITALILWLFVKEKLKQNGMILILGLVMLLDLWGVDRRYVTADDFVPARQMLKPFSPTEADLQIAKDTSRFRVFEPSIGLNGARTSYFHNSIGGYHAAKPRRLQELFEYHIANNNVGVLNMLNVKYIIQENEKGQPYAAINPYVNGNAWFVDSIKQVSNPDDEIKSLASFNTASNAVFNANDFSSIKLKTTYTVDSLASIKLVDHQPNKLTYRTNNSNEGVAVFSEMYYPYGWKATIDGQIVPHFRVNYALRALEIPAGSHEVEFSFEPKVVKTGSRIALLGNILLALASIGGGYLCWRKKKI